MSSLSEEIIQSVNIVDYITRFVKLTRKWTNRVWNCPFHNEKTPSFMVSDSKGIFKCFGCGKGWDVITFTMEYERLDFIDALKYLADQAHIDITKFEQKFQHDPKVKQHKEQSKSINQSACKHFEDNLKQSALIQQYLQTRNIDSSIVAQFQLGFAVDSYYDMINYLKKQNFQTQEVLESWICKQGPSGDIHDFFRKRLIFPIRDQLGTIIAFSWRVIDSQDSPKYLNISNTSLYDKSKALYGINFVKKHINEHNHIIVVEWYMDVIALHRLWLPIWVATCWTSLTHDHAKTIKRYTDRVSFVFDNDQAGIDATIRGLKIAYEYDLFPQVLVITQLNDVLTPLKPLKDIDDLANAWGTSDQLMSTAMDWLSYILMQLKKRYDITNPVDKKKILSIVFEVIRSINDVSILQHYIDIIAQWLSMSSHVILEQYKIRYKQNRFGGPTKDTNKRNEPIRESIDTWALIQALAHNHQWKLYIHHPWLEELFWLYNEVQTLMNDSSQESLTDQWWEKNDHDSALLWREKEFDELDDIKRNQLVKSMMIKLLTNQVKHLLKVHHISPEIKKKLTEQRSTIVRGR